MITHHFMADMNYYFFSVLNFRNCSRALHRNKVSPARTDYHHQTQDCGSSDCHLALFFNCKPLTFGSELEQLGSWGSM